MMPGQQFMPQMHQQHMMPQMHMQQQMGGGTWYPPPGAGVPGEGYQGMPHQLVPGDQLLSILVLGRKVQTRLNSFQIMTFAL